MRDAAMPPGHGGPRPSGGVGGTRRGVKCLHAHLAWYLAGGPDPVGRWTCEQLGLDPSELPACTSPCRGQHGATARGPVAAIDLGHELDQAAHSRRRRAGPWSGSCGSHASERGSTGRDASPRRRCNRTLEVLVEFKQAMDHHGVVPCPGDGDLGRTRRRERGRARPPGGRGHRRRARRCWKGEEEARLTYLGATVGARPGRRPVPGDRRRGRFDRARRGARLDSPRLEACRSPSRWAACASRNDSSTRPAARRRAGGGESATCAASSAERSKLSPGSAEPPGSSVSPAPSSAPRSPRARPCRLRQGPHPSRPALEGGDRAPPLRARRRPGCTTAGLARARGRTGGRDRRGHSGPRRGDGRPRLRRAHRLGVRPARRRRLGAARQLSHPQPSRPQRAIRSRAIRS